VGDEDRQHQLATLFNELLGLDEGSREHKLREIARVNERLGYELELLLGWEEWDPEGANETADLSELFHSIGGAGGDSGALWAAISGTGDERAQTIDSPAGVARTEDSGRMQRTEGSGPLLRTEDSGRAARTQRDDTSTPIVATTTLDALDADPAGEVLARYEVLGVLGKGGMGQVYRVRDPRLNRTMALKVVHRGSFAPEAIARFIEEAQVTAQLTHPGIIPVHELGQLSDDRLYFTMQEVKGRTFGEVIGEVHAEAKGYRAGTEPTSGWTLHRLVVAFKAACEAVAYAHHRGVVHRDIKPNNIMIGEYGEVLVLDWGLAKLVGAAERPRGDLPLEEVSTQRHETGEHITQTGRVMGTPMYMSPEQARGEVARLGPRSDVYALGAVLFELLSGKPPLRRGHALAMLLQARSGQTVELEGALPIPKELREICERAVARKPEARFDDAGALAEAVEGWLEGVRQTEQAREIVADAGRLEPEVADLRARAEALQNEAVSRLAEIRPHDPVEVKRPAWDAAAKSEALYRDAERKAVEVERLLYGALTHAELPEAHLALARRYQRDLAQAERSRDVAGAIRAEALLRAHVDALPSDHPDHRALSGYLAGFGRLTLHSEPAGASVDLYRYQLEDRRLVPVHVGHLGETPLNGVRLERGSYMVRVRADDHAAVDYPVVIERDGHWHGVDPGEDQPRPVALPPSSALTTDEIYVPASYWTCGGDPAAVRPLARRFLWTEGFIIQKRPVSNQDYLAFINDLVATGAHADVPALTPKPPAAPGEAPQPYDWRPELPVRMVTWAAASRYATWLAQSTGQPWRLPTELEWEKSARGVDGRVFPWGDFLDPTWCRMADSLADATRLAPIEALTEDRSPYGVLGLGGNTRDWCADVFDAGEGEAAPRRVVRGGGFLDGVWHCRSASRAAASPERGEPQVGFRLVRSWP
jgi:serine/threonine-protein kinase